MKNRILLFIVATLIVSPLIGQKKVLFMTDRPSDEQDQIVWLQEQGFDLTIDSLSNLKLSAVSSGMWDTINAHDLLITGRYANSSEFDDPDDRYWNALKVPHILNSAYGARSSRLKMFNSTSTGNTENPAVMALDPADEIWSAVTLTNDTMQFFNATYSYIDVDMATEPNNGTRVAEIATASGFIPIITRWNPGTEYYPESGNIPSDYKTYFGFGSNDFSFPVTDEGKKVYLAEINRLLALPDAPAKTEARLYSLSASTGTLSPAFSQDINSYTLLVPEVTDTVIIYAETLDPSAIITSDDTVVAPGTVTVSITADDGVTTMDYVIDIVLEDPVITFDVSLEDITDQEPYTDVHVIFGNNDSSALMSDPEGDMIYSASVQFERGALITYRFAYENGTDPVANQVIETIPAACSGTSGYREYIVPENSTRIAPVPLFGTCDATALMVSVTFKVNLNGVTDLVTDGAVWLVIGNWEQSFYMADYDGDGIYEATRTFEAGSELNYFFAYQNGADPAVDFVKESAPELCMNAEGYRTYTVGYEEASLPAYGFGTCFTMNAKPTIYFVGKSEDDADHLAFFKDDPEFIVVENLDNAATTSIEDYSDQEKAQLKEDMGKADIVIISRGVWSSMFDSEIENAFYRSITTPLLQVSAYNVRNSRNNWFNSGGTRRYREELPVMTATIHEPEDTVFKDVTLTNGTMDWTVTPPHDALAFSSTIESNAQIMATVGDSLLLYARFSPNTEFYPGAGTSAKGFRTYFNFGADDGGVINYFPLSEDAKKVYRNEVLRMVKLGRMNLLSSLIPSVGELEPAFDQGQTDYTLFLPSGTTEVTVTGIAANPLNVVNGNGSYSTSDEIVITVESPDGYTTEYTITIVSASIDATLSSLTVDKGTISPEFDPAVFEYNVVVDETESYVTVSATANDPLATVSGTGPIQVSPGETIKAPITVTAQDTLYTNVYNVNISTGTSVANYSIASLDFYPNQASYQIYLRNELSAD
nr:cadherin-like beta sandwich domain-containing protein [Bacteroidales bacterium]